MSMIGDIDLQKKQLGGYCLGPYRIERPLGFYQMGVQYLARDMTTDVAVALRVFRIAEEDKEHYAARTLSRLSHPNIASVHFADRIGDQFVVAIDFVEGETLQDVLSRKGRLDARETLRILSNVVSALDYIHTLPAEDSSGSAHLDLKPSSIMLGHDGTVKVIDFRLARIVAQGAPHIGRILRSPAYMAPEQVQGRPSPKSDLWTLGIILYQMLLGLAPKEGELLEGKISDFNESGEVTGFAHLPEPCKKIITRCLQPNPADRFSSVGELAAAISAASAALGPPSSTLYGAPMTADADTAGIHRAAETYKTSQEAAKPGDKQAGRSAARYAALVAAGALMLALLMFSVYWLLQYSVTNRNAPQGIAGAPASNPAKRSRAVTTRLPSTGATSTGAGSKREAVLDTPTDASHGWPRLVTASGLGASYSARIDRLRKFVESRPGREEAAQATAKVRAIEQELDAFSAADRLERSTNARICEKLRGWKDFLSIQTTGLLLNYAKDRFQYWSRQLEAYEGYADLTVRSATGLASNDSGFLEGGLPDPYFNVLDGNELLYRSVGLIDNSSPVWDKKIKIHISPGSRLYVDIWDNNLFISRRLAHLALSPLPVDGPFRVSGSGVAINLELQRDR